jgi:hypothetical protein
MWNALTTSGFDEWFSKLADEVQVEVTAAVNVLKLVGPTLGRPLVDTLSGSKHANMKELRVRKHGQIIRIAFAFDPSQSAILLTAGAKQGVSQKRFYKQLIARADALFDAHLVRLRREHRDRKKGR